jgi:hypothetical protein
MRHVFLGCVAALLGACGGNSSTPSGPSNNVDVSGSVAGDELSGAMTAGGTSITFDTTVAGSQMSGTYDAVSAGACTGDTGTFVATR